MKENVIIGKLIPAGTGMKRYRSIQLDSDVNGEEELEIDETDEFEDFDEYGKITDDVEITPEAETVETVEE
jgi:DNA-directed RNA polymerase subunit beta'